MNLIVYAVVAIALIGAAAGFYGKIHHDGYAQGTAEVKTKWDAANRAAADLEAKRQAAAKLTADTAAAELAAAQQKATNFEAKWRSERAKHSDSSLAGCSGSPTANATGSAGIQATPASVRFSSGFLRLYDYAWTGDDSQPVFGNQPTGSGQPADSLDALTAIGPGEVLDNHEANAALCSADRRKLNALIDQIEKLKAGWH